MSEGDALLAAVIANPDDDTPRLVYADWLDENGQPERAEFIRLQIGVALSQSAATKVVVPPRAKQLIDEHATEWLQPLGLIPAQVMWARGFVEHVSTTPDGFHNRREPLFSATPVSSVEIFSGHGMYGSLRLPANEESNQATNDSAILLELAEWPQLARIRHLRLFHLSIEDHEIQALAESPFISGLQSLDLSRSGVGDAGLAAIARSPNLQNLKHLCLFDVSIDATAALILAQSPYLQHAYLDLTCTLCDYEPDHSQAVEALTQRFGNRVFVTVRD